MADFLNRLKMDNLYPSFPGPNINEGNYPLFDTFMNRIAPMYNQSHGSQQQSSGMPQPTKQNIVVGDGRPGNLTNMDVIYQPSIGDIGRERSYSKNVFGEDLNPNAGYRQGQLDLRQQEINQRGQKIASDIELGKGRLGVSQKQLEINDFKSKNQGIIISAPKGGRISAINKMTGAHVADLGDTGTLSEEERVGLDQTNELARIGAKGGEERKTEGTRQEGRETLEEQTARHAMERAQLASTTQKDIAGAPNKGNQLPSQELIRKYNVAQDLKNDPKYSRYITITPGHGYVVSKPLLGDATLVDEINQKIAAGTPSKSTTKPAIQSKYKVTVN